MSVRGPSAFGDVYSVPYPSYGSDASPTGPGNFGIGGPNVPAIGWEPRGTGGPLGAAQQFVRNGIPPVSHGHVTLKSFDFISQQYLLPPTSDQANQMFKRGMLSFVVREFDKEENSTLTYPLFMINQIARDQWNDFVLATSPNRNDPDAIEFLTFMQRYGDKGLIDFAAAKRRGDTRKYDGTPEVRRELNLFMQRAEEDGYCYLTLYGFLRKVNSHGACINTNLGAGLETIDDTRAHQHYVQANLGLAKRIQLSQVFGPADQVTMGSRLWIVLKRKHCGAGKYGPFVLYPGASPVDTRPKDCSYIDESGGLVHGHVYNIGTVLEPADRSPQIASIEAANNTGSSTNVEDAYNAHGQVPTFYANMGFSQ